MIRNKHQENKAQKIADTIFCIIEKIQEKQMNKENQMGKNAKELDPKMKVYLLVGPGTSDLRKTVGFKALGSGETFTFGFSTPEKLQSFVNEQKKTGVLGNIGNEIVTYWLTLEEYFRNPENHELYIDPPNDFPMDFGLPNLN